LSVERGSEVGAPKRIVERYEIGGFGMWKGGKGAQLGPETCASGERNVNTTAHSAQNT
jgi:hypothetical protein